MAAYPAMPLFTDAYLADTRHLTTEEHGAYLLLLMCAWRSKDCALADDDGALARIAGLSPTKWRRMKPVLRSFFDIEDGRWRQAKLLSVYEGVAARVARNRASGAKGGRASALKQSAKQPPNQSGDRTGNNAASKPQATKAKAAAEPDSLVLDSTASWRDRLAGLCGLAVVLDEQTLCAWQSAGADFETTIKPTIERLMMREQKRTGSMPKRLAYYRDAVLEAHASAPPQATPQSAKTVFEPQNVEHWRRLLGDPKSQFRGDYMSQHWFIPADHPEFAARTLGANPRLAAAPLIPAAIKAEYGRAWNWQRSA